MTIHYQNDDVINCDVIFGEKKEALIFYNLGKQIQLGTLCKYIYCTENILFSIYCSTGFFHVYS